MAVYRKNEIGNIVFFKVLKVHQFPFQQEFWKASQKKKIKQLLSNKTSWEGSRNIKKVFFSSTQQISQPTLFH